MTAQAGAQHVEVEHVAHPVSQEVEQPVAQGVAHAVVQAGAQVDAQTGVQQVGASGAEAQQAGAAGAASQQTGAATGAQQAVATGAQQRRRRLRACASSANIMVPTTASNANRIDFFITFSPLQSRTSGKDSTQSRLSSAQECAIGNGSDFSGDYLSSWLTFDRWWIHRRQYRESIPCLRSRWHRGISRHRPATFPCHERAAGDMPSLRASALSQHLLQNGSLPTNVIRRIVFDQNVRFLKSYLR